MKFHRLSLLKNSDERVVVRGQLEEKYLSGCQLPPDLYYNIIYRKGGK